MDQRPQLTILGRPCPRPARPVPAAFLALAQLTLCEIRSDVAHLFDSDWAIADRCRTRRLALALEDASERQGLAELSRIIRSIAALAAVARTDATPLFPELRREFKHLIHLAEACLSESEISVA